MVDQKLMVHWQIKKGERVYVFEIPAGSPYGEIYDCGFEIMNSALEAQKQAAEQAEKQKDEMKVENAAG
jgi:hypothetical protein